MKRKIFKLLSSAKHGLFAFALAVFSGTTNSQTTYTFNYTGSTQTISLPAGNYSIECWGADGGNATNATAPMSGGKGGYSTGVYTNASTATFNIYVGGRGGNTSAANTGGGGGGMSDIAPASNTNIVIIAAGGGGGATSGSASEASTGGDGGGLTGGTAIDGTGVSSGTAATGGSQTAGGFAVAGSYGAGTPGGYGYGGGAANGGTAGVMHAAGGAGGNGGTGGWNGGGGGCTTTGGNDHAAGGGAGYYGGGGGRGDGGAGGGGSGYIGGVTSGVTTMSGTTGFVSNPDLTGNGLVLIKESCSISLSVTGTNSGGALCAGNSVTITTNAVSNYSWTTGSNLPFLVVSPSTNTVYGLTATSLSNCTASSQVSITAYPLPNLNVSANNPVVCLGNQAVITVSGANTYSWSTNSTASNITVTPTQSTLYSVTGTSTLGNCSSTGTIMVDVVTPSVTISGNTIICQGGTATLSANANGAISYSWSTGLPIQTILVSPPSNTIYVVTVIVSTLNVNCNALNSIQVTVNNNPTVTALASPAAICAKQSAIIIASGATNYTWTSKTGVPVLNSSINVASQNAAILIYTVTGINAHGCQSSITVPFIVSDCLGIEEALNGGISFEVYPNPSKGDFTIESVKQMDLVLVNELGQQVKQLHLTEENAYKVSVSDLSNGVYFIMGAGTNKKILVSK